MEVLKYERTKALQLITLPRIATNRKPYLLANADTNGPVNMGAMIVKKKKKDKLFYQREKEFINRKEKRLLKENGI